MIRILIADNIPSHYNSIITAINSGYGSDISDQIQVYGNLELCLSEAKTNNDIISIVRSYSIGGAVALFLPLYNRVLGFYPLGSNTFEKLNWFVDEEPPILVLSGAGDTENRNNTGYGNGLEFWDNDLDVGTPDLSSFSNGVVAGKLLKIKDTLQCSWWEARFRARATALQTESNRLNNGWDLYNGYGKIDVEKAIAYKGVIPLDPYLYTESDFTDLETQVETLTARIEESETQVETLTARIEELEPFEFVKNVDGIKQNNQTSFGLSTAFKLEKIFIEADIIKLHKVLYRDENSLTKAPFASSVETIQDRDIIDLLYNKYLTLHELTENDLIT